MTRGDVGTRRPSTADGQPRPGPVRRWSLLRVTAANARPDGVAIATVVGLQVAQAVALLYLPALNADIIDNGVLRGDTGRILRTGALMLCVALVQGVVRIAAVRRSALVALGVGRDLRAAVYRQVHRFSDHEVRRLGVASLITRTTNDIQQVQTVLLSALTSVVTAPVMAVGGIVMAVGQDAPLSLSIVVLVPALFTAIVLLIRRMRPLARAMQARIDDINLVLREQVSGIRIVRAFVSDDHERRRVQRAGEDLAEVAVRAGDVSTMMLPVVVNTVNLCSVAVLWFGAFRIDSGAMPIGALTAFLTYLVMVQGAVLSAVFVITGLPRAEAGADRIDEVLRTEPSVVVPPVARARPALPCAVELRGVRLRYPGAEEDVLHGIDLVARPGRTTALIGATGAGKSTIIGLVCRLFDPTAGTVRLGGVDVRELDAATLAATVGLVPQSPRLFSGTIASNLRYGRPAASDEELWRALETAQARGFVSELDRGLDATVAPGAANLSGGQRQRLAIARALVARPAVYLLDDCFSALDYSTDALLREALRREAGEATVVVVAQRVTTIMDADQIVVLGKGAVAGAGTHGELLRASAVYREIVRSQLGEEAAR